MSNEFVNLFLSKQFSRIEWITNWKLTNDFLRLFLNFTWSFFVSFAIVDSELKVRHDCLSTAMNLKWRQISLKTQRKKDEENKKENNLWPMKIKQKQNQLRLTSFTTLYICVILLFLFFFFPSKGHWSVNYGWDTMRTQQVIVL